MRTIDLSTVFYRYLQLAGLDRSSITAQMFAQFRDFANGRLDGVWKSDVWPDLLRVTTTPGDPVTTDAEGIRTVTLASDVGEVLNVYNADPRLTTRAHLVKYFLYEDGTDSFINLMENVTPVWIEYRIGNPELYGDAWSATVAYSVGAQAYFDTSTNTGSFTPGAGKQPKGNLYNCIVATTANQSPTSNASSWQKVEIPYFLGDYVARASLSDYLRAEGQYDQAQMAENDAEQTRQKEVERILMSEGQVRRMNFFNY